MTDKAATIIYTQTDEAPAMATRSLLPIVQKFASKADINVETSDISLAGRIIAHFPERLTEDQRIPDTLKELSEVIQSPDANIIKLPNISASIPQLKAAIRELQEQGYDLPEFLDEPETDEEKAIGATYSKILGSAVNPVLREGNSDRRAPPSVKQYARDNPHYVGQWSQASRSHVAHMRGGDFYSSETSTVVKEDCNFRIEFVDKATSEVKELKGPAPLLKSEVIDGMFMSKKALREFFEKEITDCKETGVLFSLHVKATMMKVSHPIVFGHAVTVFYKDLFEKWAETFEKLGVEPNNGLGNVYTSIQDLPQSKRAEIEADIRACYINRPEIAMVDSNRGISNLQVPSDVIVDASMPAMIRNSGQMWGADGQLKDTKAVIPESTYATIYQEIINFCKTNGAFDPTTMGSVPNVGLMAQKAEEYGSHDKTFELEADGTIRVVDDNNNVMLHHDVEKGDIWRMCQTKDEPIRDWVKLAVKRARVSGTPAIFWLDDKRAHDSQLITKVNEYLKEHDTEGLDIQIKPPVRAIRATMERLIEGKDTISVTGNVLRDYLTDLFPILEVGTSAKMLSVVPLMKGGGMFETGAGGSAPKLYQQLNEENHLRWDSLGEFLALTVSFEHLAEAMDNPKSQLLSETLDKATGDLLSNGKSPKGKAGMLDNRGSHFYLALYWANALAEQDQDPEMKAQFTDLAKQLADNEEKIVGEFTGSEGEAVDVGGYYKPDDALADAIMRPSETFNNILASFS